MAPLTSSQATAAFDWAVAAQPFPGELESGDLHVVVANADGLLVGVIDGLGHGPEAAASARLAAAALEENANLPVEVLLRHCDAATRGTRGAAVTLARVETRTETLTWAGVGNVIGVLVRFDPGEKTTWAPVRPGIVGSNLPSMRVNTVAIRAGDQLVLATDGLRPAFASVIASRGLVQNLADGLLTNHGVRDDQLVLVGRYGRGDA
jgi:negative regulator of sigma-B (phosphoserine phosphatase)